MPRDDLGRVVRLGHPARRVVCIGPGATETIYALGAGGRLVGRDTFSSYPAATKKVPVVGDYRGPFFESTLAVRPDLIVVQGETYDAVRADDWGRKCGAPVAILNASTVNGVAQDIQKLGAWLGAGTKSRLITRPVKLPPMRHATAFFEVDRSLWTAGDQTLIGDVMKRAGLENVAAGIHSYKQYNLETLLANNPEYYIVGGNPQDRAQIIRRLQNTPGVNALRCIRQGRIAIINSDWIARPGPRLWMGIRALAAATHGGKR